MNLNVKQVLAIVMAVLGAVAMASTQLVDMGATPAMAKSITAAAGFVNTVLGTIVAILNGQANTIKEVAAMPGVEEIKVNTKANQVLASVALDPAQDKVSPVSGQDEEVKDIAES